MRAARKLTVSSGADWPRASGAVGRVLLEGEKLLSAEGLVVDLRCGLDEILEMGAEKEVAEVDEFAMVLVLDVDDAPAVLATPNLLAVDDDGLLRSNDGEGDEALYTHSQNAVPHVQFQTWNRVERGSKAWKRKRGKTLGGWFIP